MEGIALGLGKGGGGAARGSSARFPVAVIENEFGSKRFGLGRPTWNIRRRKSAAVKGQFGPPGARREPLVNRTAPPALCAHRPRTKHPIALSTFTSCNSSGLRASPFYKPHRLDAVHERSPLNFT
ncbi:hypothetical protein EVAR_83615_1 [Eumeta japonica]|uniref:Uncharacterized protein n=1 Tax=Eumeta variegata TaxID=151549 RepID=A0A4C1UQ70_EUMVA|nr:hypothetical protein EVAR_83615_1 [Eumeta japonica]